MSAASSACGLALVTGGTRRVGAAIAARLAERGYAIALTSHNGHVPQGALAHAFDSFDTRWHVFDCDLDDAAKVATLIGDVADHFGHAPDLLVNSASIFGQEDWRETQRSDLDRQFAVNMFAPVLLARDLAETAGGAVNGARPSIVHILDQRIRNPNRDQLSYTLSKQALAQSVRTLAVAFGAHARVNGIAPGLTLPTADYDETQLERLAAAMPLGRLPDPQDIAGAVLYLAGARAVTGQIVYVDGGAHLTGFDRDFVHMGRD